MPRFKIIIEYDGTPFVGWQQQDNGPSIQAAVSEAVYKISGERVTIFGAGRTDAGVHALGQVAHFDLNRSWDSDKLRDGLNYHLKPDPIAILLAEEAGVDFDARFHATKRHYLYRIVNRRSPLTLERGHAWLVARPLDADAMHEAAQLLAGHHDFTTFRAAHCQAKSPEKTLDKLDVSRYGDDVELHISARSFLHNQVRSIMGSLKLVGEGKWRTHDLKQALRAKDRSRCGPVAPPDGLYLMRVDYADGDGALK